jgi:hypothetical protein
MIADQAYLARSKAAISIEAAVVGLDADRLVGGPWLVLSLDHPLVRVMHVRTGHKEGASACIYLLSHGAIWDVALDLVAFSGAVVPQIEHEVSAGVLDNVDSIGGERHCIRCRLLV